MDIEQATQKALRGAFLLGAHSFIRMDDASQGVNGDRELDAGINSLTEALVDSQVTAQHWACLLKLGEANLEPFRDAIRARQCFSELQDALERVRARSRSQP